MTVPDSVPTHAVLLFDGHCNLCNFWVNFLLIADSRHKLSFAAQQSAAGKQLILLVGNNAIEPESVILIDRGMPFTRSDAVLKTLRLLGGFWRLLYILVIIPRPIRDFVYDFIARRRFRWFGRRDQCRIPSSQERERFLD